MAWRRAGRAAALALLIGCLAEASACGRFARPPRLGRPGQGGAGAPAEAARPIPVVAAENFYGDVVAQLCGSRCRVSSILSNPDADPHVYESSVADARAVAGARLVVRNGVGYDTFIRRLAAASPNPRRIVVDAQTVTGTAGDANPHLWYSLDDMARVAKACVAALDRIDPAGRAVFGARLGRFLSSLDPIRREVAAIRSADPHAPVAYTEPVFGYMGQAIGLDVLTSVAFQQAVEDGNDPAAAAVAQEEDLLNRHRVRVLIYNLQTVTPVTTTIQNLARSDGVPIVGVSETEPPHTSYQRWMMRQLRALRSALGGTARGR